MVTNKNIKLSAFMACQARQCTWFNDRFFLPPGAVAAFGCYKLGLTPNVVSILSVICLVAGPLAVYFSDYSLLLEGIFLCLVLQAAHILDCADGTLARAAGMGSPFGSILDKVVDTVSFICPVSILAAKLANDGDGAELLIICALHINARVALAVAVWWKELLTRGGDRLTEDTRARSLGYLARKFLLNIIDTPTFNISSRSAGSWASSRCSVWDSACWFSLLRSLTCGNPAER